MKISRLVAAVVLLVPIILVSGCNLTATSKPPTPTEPAKPPSPTEPPTQQVPTDVPTPPPAPTPTPFPNPVLKVVGSEEVVFDWTFDRCSQENLPDLPSRAFRDAEGQVQFIISHFINYRMTGPDLNNLEMDCEPILSSQYEPEPSLYSDAEWIASPYTEDGQTIYALVHNEHQGHTHPGQCPQGDYFPCWYNSVTLAVSTDEGRTFQHAAVPPAHRVAGLPYPYEAGSGPYGIFNPSNIIKGPDGYYYAFGRIDSYVGADQGVCLMRTDDLSAPESWRFWDGSAFEGRFYDPYTDDMDNPAEHDCPSLEWDNIGASLNASITYNTYLGRYVLIGNSADWLDDREVWGFYYAFSDDLIHWTRRKLLVEITLPWTAEDFTDVMYLYPSLLDPDSESRNFETAGKTAYLYYTRLNFGQGNLDRDLVRVVVEFFPSEADVPQVDINSIEELVEAVALSIVNREYNVPANTPVDLTLVWETQTAEQVADFLASAQFEIALDGAAMPNVMDYWGDIHESGDRYSSQWLYPIGILSPGSHQVEVRLSLTEPVTDGLGTDYSGVILTNTLQIEVEE